MVLKASSIFVVISDDGYLGQKLVKLIVNTWDIAYIVFYFSGDWSEQLPIQNFPTIKEICAVYQLSNKSVKHHHCVFDLFPLLLRIKHTTCFQTTLLSSSGELQLKTKVKI
jgi:hypothetical protein